MQACPAPVKTTLGLELMRLALNGWQRLWVVVAALTFAFTLVVVANIWPQRESGVLSDLGSPECKHWLELPAGFFPDQSPRWQEPCSSLQSFLYWNKVNLRGAPDYDSYLLRSRAKVTGVALASWLGVMLFIYVVGCSVAWIRRGFSAASKAQQGAPPDGPDSRGRG